MKQILSFTQKTLFYCCIALLGMTHTVHAQFVATPLGGALTPTALVQNNLVGQGVTISNVTIGAGSNPRQYGTFTNAGSNLPFSSGVFMATGFVDDFNGVVTNTNGAFGSIDGFCLGGGICTPGDAQLDAIIFPFVTNDAAILEFDFIPQSDTVRFRYVFASEEYDEYACSDFNDVFAFFVSGPGVPLQNIALIPGTTIPVAINSVNSGVPGAFASFPHTCVAPTGSLAFSSLFQGNANGAFIEFDGMTVSLEATVVVVPCSTYHIKLAIADATDGAFDSGVFLEASSFSADVVVINSLTADGDTTTTEGCDTAQFVFQLTSPVAADSVIHFTIGGTATNGVDYVQIADSIVILAGNSSALLTIIPIDDGIADGGETVIISVTSGLCVTFVSTATLYINEDILIPPPSPTCSVLSATSVEFSWAAVPSATGYEVSTDGGLTWIPPNPGPLSHEVTGLPSGGSATILVRSVGGVQNCDDNPVDTITCSACSIDVLLDNQVNASCNGATDGEATVSVSGSFPPFSLLWSNGETSATATGLGAGQHSVSATDASACVESFTVTITEPTAISLTTATTDATCNGGTDGTATVTPFNGVTPYVFLWSNNGTDANITGLVTGTYDVTVTDDNGCTATTAATVGIVGSILVNEVVTDATCNTSNGTIDLTPATGTAPYTFEWSTGATTEDLTGLATGIYMVTTTDVGGCFSILNITVGTIGGSTITVDSVADLSCNGDNSGFIDITVSDSVACSSPVVTINELMYRPNINNGNATDPLTTGEYIELIGPPGANIGCYVLTDGDWTVTIPPGTIIPADGLFTLGHNNSPYATTNGIIYDLDVANCGCFVSATSGSGILIFADAGEYLAIFDAAGAFLEGLLYGTPTVGSNDPPNGSLTTGGVINTVGTVGCVSSVTIPGPAAFQSHPGGVASNTSLIRSPDGSGAWTTQVDGSPNACNAASTPTFTYQWSNAATTEDISGLAAGTYTVTVSDGSGCDAIQSFTVTEPSAITVTTDAVNDATCAAAGSVLISVAGGTANYTFLWSNGATTEDISGLSADTYTVTVTDANGCEMLGTSYIVGSVGVPILSDTVTHITCFGFTNGSTTIFASGGNPGYTFLWDANANNQTTATATGLGAGTYNVTVTDNASCTVSRAVTVTEPSAVSAAVTTTSATCVNSDGAATVVANGGTGALSFQWGTGETSQNIANLPGPSNVSVTVTDANDCTVSSTTIPVGLDTTIALSGTSSNLDCSGDSTGSVILLVSNAGLPYSYIWSNGATSDTINGLGIGTYNVTVTDASGCTISDSYTVTTPFLPNVNAFIGQAGIVDSTIILGESIAINAGNDETTLGVTYQWIANPTDANIANAINPATTVSPSTETTYTFTIIATSADGCSDTSAVSLTVEGLRNPQIPSAFTPNGDNNNDEFGVVNLDAEHIIDFHVFNRWGQVVFDNADASGKWDGTLNGTNQPTDAYVYIVSYQRPNDPEPIVVRGVVTLLR